MKKSLVTVVIPAYNSEKHINQAVNSAFAQGVELEVIVVNDASTDTTVDMLEEYLQRDNFTLLENEKNSGVAISRNKGVAAAHGEYIAFLDADDWWEEDKLEKQLAAMRASGSVISSTARELVDDKGDSKGITIGVRKRITYKMMLYQNWLNCSAVLVKRDVIKDFPMQHDDSHEDYITWMKILEKYQEATGVDEPLLKYRISNFGKSGSKWNSAKMMYKAYRYLGIGPIKSAFYFCTYAINGVKKYYFNRGENR